MKKNCFAILASCFLHAASGQSNDLETIKKINLDWLNSYPKKDTATLSKIFADDIIVINTTGATLKKNEILTRIMEPNRQYISAKLDSLLEARVIGNTGITITKTTLVRKLDGVQSVMRSCCMSVYEKEKANGLLWHHTAHCLILNRK